MATGAETGGPTGPAAGAAAAADGAGTPAGADGEGYHFGVIVRALAEIDAAGTPVSLADLAARIGMSPAHFQRVFSRWVGVSPKRYQQYLALDAARRLLAARHTTLAAALGAGLSGPGRLHDLFLRWEAMAPGDYARAGAGLTIRHGVVDTPYGPAVAMATDHGLCGLGFAAVAGVAAVRADLAARWPAARFVPDPAAVAGPVAVAFGGGRVAVHGFGAPFQIKVWEALLAVPEGHVTTYADVARAVGHPRAVRAVGTAVGRNPLGGLIPCHRVLRASGALGGYRWGLPVKRAMLAREAARVEAAATAAPAP